MKHPLTAHNLTRQSCRYAGTGGVSLENRSLGFQPAFLDTETGEIHLSCYASGQPAPLHVLEGLPAALVIRRNAQGKVVAAKASLSVGFVYDGKFFTREECAAMLQERNARIA